MKEYTDKQYRNVFTEIGIEPEQVEKRLNEIKKFYFYKQASYLPI